MSEWIACKWREPTPEELERMPEACSWADFVAPEDEQNILVTMEYTNHKTGKKVRYVTTDVCLIDEGLGLDSGNDWQDIIAWMPYPEPYKGDIEDAGVQE